ncbi:conserved hypothetical protein [Sulfolobus islandicus Y.G.57.14]|jgi:hypothetical protein|uniref:Uncharacterized protein n=6 Tax=Saccharolobus islandicus TaxID=43080 RepID=C3MPV0_SACI2|nr:hypothetical protein [Sulfolobus islandicus]ACP35413.1 conserved hypothetical protein [Sulfolobus islandicus L.S.2.15]ACP38072.1 conserved hypothetical protein [Sulfolobus islandicus M.14.25]ACP45579.1 conserved hypothetical protein [Sulfolobus islandicus Y.G.57.14]ACP55251.1 conserved hypothetical protein [Sulfolobus islandicus M.16.27]ACR41906.1 conserved hypothetical protein [Sulfolobus islandicus M.16.4]
MNLASYYKLEPLKINDVVLLYALRRTKEAEIIDGIRDLESIMPDEANDVVIIEGSNEKYINGRFNLDFQFSRPLNVISIGVPQFANGDQVQITRIDVNMSDVIGGVLVKRDLPFIVFFTHDGTKIISMSDINPPIPEKKDSVKRAKKKKKRSKKRAKKSSSKSKSKSKSSGKS